MRHSRPLFLLVKLVDKTLPMSGIEPRVSGVGSDRSTNCAKTTSQVKSLSLNPTTFKAKNANRPYTLG